MRLCSGCWARTASGHAAAQPPITLMKSCRLIVSPEVDEGAAYQIGLAMSAMGQKQT